MKQAYVITEGVTDRTILENTLPSEITKNTEFISAGGLYSLQSLARSILAVKRSPVALVVDADAAGLGILKEKEEFVRESLAQASPGIPFEVFIVTPILESMSIESIRQQPIIQELEGFLWSVFLKGFKINVTPSSTNPSSCEVEFVPKELQQTLKGGKSQRVPPTPKAVINVSAVKSGVRWIYFPEKFSELKGQLEKIALYKAKKCLASM